MCSRSNYYSPQNSTEKGKIASAGKASLVQNAPAGLEVFSGLAVKWNFARQMRSASCDWWHNSKDKLDSKEW